MTIPSIVPFLTTGRDLGLFHRASPRRRTPSVRSAACGTTSSPGSSPPAEPGCCRPRSSRRWRSWSPGVVAALIARSAVRATLRACRAGRRRPPRSPVWSAAARWPRTRTDDAVSRRRAARLRTEADVRTRLLPLPGAELAADWASARTDALQAAGRRRAWRRPSSRSCATGSSSGSAGRLARSGSSPHPFRRPASRRPGVGPPSHDPPPRSQSRPRSPPHPSTSPSRSTRSGSSDPVPAHAAGPGGHRAGGARIGGVARARTGERRRAACSRDRPGRSGPAARPGIASCAGHRAGRRRRRAARLAADARCGAAAAGARPGPRGRGADRRGGARSGSAPRR